MNSDKRVLIIGCGIGGPVVAMGLQQLGFEPVLFEARAESADEAGSFLSLASNGLVALKTLGVSASLLDAGFPTSQTVLWSGTGKRLGHVPNGATLEDGTTTLTIKRGALHRALRQEAVRRGIELRSGHALKDIDASSNGLTARFENGAQERGVLLIGADGLHSKTRRWLSPQTPSPRYTGQLSVGGIAPRTDLAPTPGEYHMVVGRRAFFGYSIRPSGEAYWFANLTAPEPGRGALRSIEVEAWKRRLLDLFAVDVGAATTLISATRNELGVYPIHDLPRVPTWQRDRVVLLGDSAHATSPSAGQGASMAIEDALVLCRCLRGAPVDEALARYERTRRPRVERVVKYSARITNSKVAGPVGRVIRDALMPLALRFVGSGSQQDWLYRPSLQPTN